MGALIAASLLLATTSPGLSVAEVGALRHIAWTSTAFLQADDPAGAAFSEAVRAGVLAPVDAGRVATALAREGSLALVQIRDQRRLLHAARGRRAAWWWDPRQRTADGTPYGGPDAAAISAFDDALEGAALAFGVPAPEDLHVRVDLEAGEPRIYPPSDLRYGVIVSGHADRLVAARVVLLSVGESPFLVEALARLWACGDSRACRLELLDSARIRCVTSGYVPLLEAAPARVLRSMDDPAVASGVLLAEHLQRLHPPRATLGLLAALGGATDDAAARVAVERAVGESAARLDRAVSRDLRDWAARRRPPPHSP